MKKKKGKKKYTITSEQQFDFQKPKYNGFAGGYGPHKNKKEKRKQNWNWKNEIEEI